MNVLRRSILYIWRKKVRSLIMLSIMLVLLTTALVSIAIKKGAETAENHLETSIGGGFVVKENKEGRNPNDYEKRDMGNGSYAMLYKGDSLTPEIVEKIEKVNGVEGYNAENIGPANLKTDDDQYLKLKEIEGSFFANDEIMSNQANVYGYTDAKKAELFTSGTLKLVEGRFINAEDKNKIMIHKDLAERNGLKIGDYLQIAMNPYMTGDEEAGKLKERAEIVGIFSSTAEAQISMFSTPGDLFENMVIMDVATTLDLYSWASEGYYKVYYNVKNPGDMDKIIKEIKSISDVNWDAFTITANDKSYEAITKPLEDTQNTVKNLLIITIVISVLILILVLTLWNKSRIKENGILLSIGVGKSRILIQRILELCFVLMFAIVLSYCISIAIGEKVGNEILKNYEVTNTSSEESELTTDGQFGYTLPNMIENNLEIEEINTKIGVNDAMIVYGGALAIIFFAVFISSYTIYKTSPKKMLSNIS